VFFSSGVFLSDCRRVSYYKGVIGAATNSVKHVTERMKPERQTRVAYAADWA
jgi:hypothetical protein